MIIIIFLGYTPFGGGKDYQTPNKIDNINKVEVENCIINDLYITSETDIDTMPLNETWNWDTILHATFDNTLLAGNVDFAVDQISAIRIKYREYGSTDWITLTDVKIEDSYDLIFERYNKWCRGGKTPYEFALIPVAPSGVEGNYSTNNIISDFNDLFVMSKDHTFHAINEEVTPTRNQDTNILKPLTGKYPVIISNDELNYDSLSVKAMFITTKDGMYDKIGAWKYREQAKQLLASKQPLLLKTQDGRMWLIGVTDMISDDSSDYIYEGKTMTTFTCCEIGNANEEQDLIDNGLIE